MKYISLLVFTLLAISFFSLLSCNNSKKDVASSENAPPLPPDFMTFYQSFHVDSSFQMQHIVFPLQGYPDYADSLTLAEGSYRWLPENWTMQRSIDFEMSEFKRHFETVNEQMVVERIVHQNGTFGMVRRFAKVAGEWHLIYYAGMNKLAL